MKKAFEPVTKSIGDVSGEATKIMTENFFENNRALEKLNVKLLEKMKDRGIIAFYFLSLLSKITNSEITNQLILVRDSSSNRVNDLLIHKTIPITLHNNLLTFCDTCKIFELKADLLKMITKKNYNVDLASLQDEKLMYDFERPMKFELKAQGIKYTRDKTLI